MIRVLLVDDSTTTRELLASILREDPEIEVVGEAKNGLEAVELTRSLRPDVVSMDIVMPEMDGFEATKKIMAENPTPIVIVSNVMDVHEVKVSLEALRAGALAVGRKPGGPEAEEDPEDRSLFTSTLKIMSKVKVVGFRPSWDKVKLPPASGPLSMRLRLGEKGGVVVISAAAGGPAALNRIFSDLPGDFPAPILVVQQMAKGFISGCASWMNGNSSLRIKVAKEGEALVPGTVYLGDDDRHLGVSDHSTVLYSAVNPIGGFRPSGTFLFESAAKAYGSATLGIVMTGTGSDGVMGLKAIKAAGGWVLVQNESSSMVFGMPQEAIKSGYADEVLPLGAMAKHLMEMIPLGVEKRASV